MTNSAQCLFCLIAKGEVPAHLVYESPNVMAFLDIHPIRAGHVQVIPRKHFAYFDSLPPSIAQEILAVGQHLAPVLRERSGAQRVAFLFTGTDIAHAHAHVLPLLETTDITSRQYIAEEQVTFRSTPRVPDSELAATASALRAALSNSARDA
jgi:histidine triad (HIT) family protein